KYAGYITDTQNLGDEIVELDTIIHHDSDVYGKHAIPIQPIEKYDMVGRLYRSNIIGSYIVLKSDYPVIYLTVEYNRSFISGSLLQIYLSIQMDKEHKKEINLHKKYKNYRNLHFNGEWNLSIDCDEELKELWKNKMEEKLREEISLDLSSEKKLVKNYD